MTSMVYSYRSQTKLREGNVFTRVCDSIHREGGLCPGGVSVQWVSVQGGLCPGRSLSGGLSVRETPSATIWLHVGGMHPTGMHSCYRCVSVHGGKYRGEYPSPRGVPPLPRYMGYYGIRSTSGRYAFYWNAFLFLLGEGLFFIHCMRIIMFFLAKFPLPLADLGGARPARAPPFAWHPSFWWYFGTYCIK